MNPNSLANLNPIKPGEVRNPTGINISKFETYIKSQTNGGFEMVDKAITLMRKAETQHLQFEATKWLVERSFGKAPIVLGDGDGNNYDLQKLLYIELSKHKDESGVFDIPEGTVSQQDLENK